MFVVKQSVQESHLLAHIFQEAKILQNYVDDVCLLCENVNTTMKNIEVPFYASTEVGLEVNIEKSNYGLCSPSSIWESQ
jgi:hypothetical protein